MTCDRIRERLTAYLDGDLDPDRGTVVRGHLRTCDACRQVAADEAALRDGLRALPTVDPPPSLWANVQAQLAAAEVAASQQPAWRRAVARWRPMVPRIAFGGLVAATAAGVLVWRLGRSTEDGGPLPRIAEHPSTEVQASAPPPAPPVRAPSVPSGDDATADLLAEPARVTASYEASATALLALAGQARPGWTDAAKATFDARVVELKAAIDGAAEGRPRQKAYRALIRYVQTAVVRDDVLLASVGGTP